MRLIESHNQEYELGLHSYELGMNHLGDMVNTFYNQKVHMIWLESCAFFSPKGELFINGFFLCNPCNLNASLSLYM